jgi:hypothetical protein
MLKSGGSYTGNLAMPRIKRITEGISVIKKDLTFLMY